MNAIARLSFLPLLVLAGCAARPEPFADVHLHYYWDHAEVTPAAAAARKLREQNVVLAVVSGVPSARALELRAEDEGRILAFFSPYVGALSRYDWHRDPRLLEQARAGLAAGDYVGIGEIHIGVGVYPDNPNFRGLLALAREYSVPVLVHTDASDHRFFAPVCREFSDVRFLWAHAGALGPEQVEAMLGACANVWVEFSARDPWHYGNLVDRDGRLPAAWAELIARWPDRFMTGTDPVWNAHQAHRWYEANAGWEHYEELLAFHRGWLGQLPPDLAERVRLGNALEFFGRSRR